MMIKEMRSEDKPRERFAKAPDTASMVDLVAILLRTGRHGCSVMDMAQEVVEQIRLSTDVNGFDNLDWRDLISVKGVGQDKAITVCAAVELGRSFIIRKSWRILVSPKQWHHILWKN